MSNFDIKDFVNGIIGFVGEVEIDLLENISLSEVNCCEEVVNEVFGGSRWIIDTLVGNATSLL